MPTPKGMFRQVRIPVLLTFLIINACVVGVALAQLRPTPPQGLNATAGPGQIFLSWQPPVLNGGAPILGYNISRGTSPSGETYLTTIGNQTSFTDESVSPATTYYYTVTAFNIAGESPPSNEASATTPAVPSPPRSLTASAGTGRVSLAWMPPTSDGGSVLRGYNIFRGSSPNGEIFLTSIGPQTTYTDSPVSAGTTYYYKVTAFNAVGQSALSNEASATTFNFPSTPTNLAATGGASQVILTWNIPTSTGGSPIAGYAIYRGTTSGGESLHTSVGVVTTFTDTQVTAGTRYYYKVAAINSVGIGSQSNEANATPTSAPSQPVLGFVETNAWWFILIASFGGLIVGWALGRPKAMAWYSRAPPPCGVTCNCTGAMCAHGAGHAGCAAPGCGPAGGHVHCARAGCLAGGCGGTCTLPAAHAGPHACSHGGHGF